MLLLDRLQELEKDFEEGDITKKGFYKKKWKLLQPYVSLEITDKVRLLQSSLDSGKLTEV